MRLAIVTSHPIQYYAPLFRALSHKLDLHVFFSDTVNAQQQSSGFGRDFSWDIDLTAGYSNSILQNVSRRPDVETFSGCDTPEIFNRLRDGRFDALLTVGWHLKSLLQAVWAAKRLGIPVCTRGDSQLATRRSLPKRMLKRITHTSLLRVFNAALFVGKHNCDYYVHYGYPRERLFHSPHAIDTARFSTAATPQDRLRVRSGLGIGPDAHLVMFAGKLMPVKRPLDLVASIDVLRQKGADVQLLIVGSGELGEALQTKAQELKVPLHNLGFQNQSQIPAAYAAADALVLPSTSETWGLVCNEALACGTPIVVSNSVGCAPDLAADGHVGRTFRTGDTEDLASALADLFANPPSETSIRAVSDRFSLNSAAAGIVEAVAFMTRNNRHPPIGTRGLQ
jgi:glycosyltransferase involved in cell wall biosynthesis